MFLRRIMLSIFQHNFRLWCVAKMSVSYIFFSLGTWEYWLFWKLNSVIRPRLLCLMAVAFRLWYKRLFLDPVRIFVVLTIISWPHFLKGWTCSRRHQQRLSISRSGIQWRTLVPLSLLFSREKVIHKRSDIRLIGWLNPLFPEWNLEPFKIRVVLSSVWCCYAVQGGFNFCVCPEV